MDIKGEILDYLVRNNVSTTEVADVLGKTGVIPNLMPVNRGHYRAGEVKWIYAYEESNWSVHEQAEYLEDGKIVVVSNFGCGDRAIFGELVSKYLLLYRQSKAIVVDGKMRDASALIKENWPIWCNGFNPVGCFNRKPSMPLQEELEKNNRKKYEGAIAVCDDCGVVIIPKEKINEDLLYGLKHIENQEDIWFDRLDHYKESTFEIVCRKNYMRDEDYMSQHMVSR